jgi:hypothetical protein
MRARPAAVYAWAAAGIACLGRSDPRGDFAARPEPADLVYADDQRRDALARAQVWSEPSVPVAAFDFRADADGRPGPAEEVVCRFQLKASAGLTPKFACVLDGGEVVKVKYGRYNAEPQAEVAASRLLTALGFGADRMSVVRRVRCYGCPPYPYPRQAWFDGLRAAAGGYRVFEDVVVERSLPGRAIESPTVSGWGFYELARARVVVGGASAAQRDALLLMAAFLNHWDNKSGNQRLLCRPGSDGADGSCRAVLAFIQDLGSSFGPWKVDLEGWRRHPVFADPRACRLSMEALPFEGGTFPEGAVGEEGRRRLAQALGQLRPEQVHDLFTAARFAEAPTAGGATVEAWASAFRERVRQIQDAGPCPAP